MKKINYLIVLAYLLLSYPIAYFLIFNDLPDSMGKFVAQYLFSPTLFAINAIIINLANLKIRTSFWLINLPNFIFGVICWAIIMMQFGQVNA